jgi:translation initiation factor 5B
MGIKISAPLLDKAIGGARIYVAKDDDEVEYYKELAMQDVNDLQRYATKGPGVWIQAPTLGSLEAFLEELRKLQVPVKNFGIGPIHRMQVIRAQRMVESHPEYGTILGFDVKVTEDAKLLADREDVKIFTDETIYRLAGQYKVYADKIQVARREAAAPQAVFPCRLKILRVFANKDPIVLGVDLTEGTLRKGTPLGVVKKGADGKRSIVALGKITSIEINHKPMDVSGWCVG